MADARPPLARKRRSQALARDEMLPDTGVEQTTGNMHEKRDGRSCWSGQAAEDEQESPLGVDYGYDSDVQAQEDGGPSL